MPVFRMQQQTFRRAIQQELFFRLVIIIINAAASFQADRGLDCLLMPVSSSYRIINTIDIKYAFDREGDDLFDNGKVTAGIGERVEMK